MASQPTVLYPEEDDRWFHQNVGITNQTTRRHIVVGSILNIHRRSPNPDMCPLPMSLVAVSRVATYPAVPAL
jgi:hypothetical protein